MASCQLETSIDGERRIFGVPVISVAVGMVSLFWNYVTVFVLYFRLMLCAN